MKNIIMIALLGSFVFSGVTFNKTVHYGDLDQDNVSVDNGMGVDFDLNDTMSIGYDTNLGMLVKADSGVAGVTVRIGYMGASSSVIGISRNWWSGGDGIAVGLGTSIDYATSGGGEDATSIGLNLSWGF